MSETSCGSATRPSGVVQGLELVIRGAHLGPYCYPIPIGLLDRGLVTTDGIVTHDYGLEAWDEATCSVRMVQRGTTVATATIRVFLLFGLAAAAFLDAYLVTDVGGRWIEQFDASTRPVARVVPASTFSHIVVAFEELLERLAQT